MDLIIADACSLILLAKITILSKTCTTVTIKITKEVKEECLYKKDGADTELLQKHLDDGRITVASLHCKEEKHIKLGKGELSALQLYKQEKAKAVLTDDGKTIKYCRLMNISYTTTPLVLFSLYKKQKITKEKAQQALEILKREGRYAEDIIAHFMLKIGGEKC
jgi:predicted nucleic acid-binding protein